VHGQWKANANNHSFKAIYLNIGTTTVSSIQNNAIEILVIILQAKPLRAIEVNAGAVNRDHNGKWYRGNRGWFYFCNECY
jgi:hypothetical protein